MLRTTRYKATCEHCEKTFSKREHYERHVRTHTGERPFRCTVCHHPFTRQDTLARHIRLRHKELANASPQATSVLSDRQTHLRSRSDDEVTASYPRNVQELDHQIEPRTAANDQGLDTILETGLEESGTAFGDFDWMWNAELELNEDFDLWNLGTTNIELATHNMPWIPFRPPETTATEHQIQEKPATQWFGRLPALRNDSNASTVRSPASSTGAELSRLALSSSLNQKVPETPLPSTEFLNRCIHNFTMRLWPLVSMIHLPTFIPSETNPLLLLSICSLGGLLEGSSEAREHAKKLFRAVHKAILVSFDPARIWNEDAIGILQAVVLGQTFAFLSSDAEHNVTGRLFHGTLTTAFRIYRDAAKDGSESLNTPIKWQSWIKQQTLLRILNLIQVHDGELVAMFHDISSLRTSPKKVAVAAPDSLFLAKTEQEWQLMLAHQTRDQASSIQVTSEQRTPYLSLCASLEAIMACSKDRPENQSLDMLLDWARHTSPDQLRNGFHGISLRILWHSCFIYTLCDMNSMEQIYGRDGSSFADSTAQHVRLWADSEQALRCLAHALLILELVEQFRISDVPGVHVPRSCFHAGLVLATCSNLMVQRWNFATRSLRTLGWPELAILESNGVLSQREWASATKGIFGQKDFKASAYLLSTLLRNIKPWLNAKKFADTLDSVLNNLDSNEGFS